MIDHDYQVVSNHEIKRALAVIVKWCVNKKGTRKKRQKMLTLDLGL